MCYARGRAVISLLYHFHYNKFILGKYPTPRPRYPAFQKAQLETGPFGPGILHVKLLQFE